MTRPDGDRYVGRFAPSPTGPLHLGSLAAAMASYLDARAHDGLWLVRIEDLDFDRNVAGADHAILDSLQRCGMHIDGEVQWQSKRLDLYETAFAQLAAQIYPCACSRREIADSRTGTSGPAALIYPGTCRNGVAAGKRARAYRLRVPCQPEGIIRFHDRWYGAMAQDLGREVGDFVLRRADGFWAYQLAVVVDDAAQGVTHVVRGADLLDSTARQIYLQRLLGYPQPAYLHVPVVTNALGEKLSKQTGAQAFDDGSSNQDLLHRALLPAAQFLGLQIAASSIEEFWERAVPAWKQLLEKREVG
ncbi:tRNA glutamyl-Q(34) synthetase GluQRS [Undibacterium sp.]|jgi:glutamyl-Q tRNA(Asp) synthetase|uniref:tRNA glutamyl-Q(34) synthetase GluQRS n=1 Tax=Undibacterium sp. TaxID=1914977 RepID=UPI002C4A9728|nr:tRNA glutamyl-Q(34) synthetase GluQRS [Undibacterium sp.]HTD03160.1 tRNA glutamyl-Q(34) synthetase GluQRS [Undibacterium sp.]